MFFSEEKTNPMDYSPLALAYIGDSVYDLYVRGRVLLKGNRHVTQMHKDSVSFVKAHSQAQSAYAIEKLLTEEELRILKWGRNAKSNTTPKNADVLDYRLATGFETLIGYLYLKKDEKRLKQLMNIAYETVRDNIGVKTNE